MLTVYHGSITKVDYPIAKAGRENLDFGQGFYITNIREQAEKMGLSHRQTTTRIPYTQYLRA